MIPYKTYAVIGGDLRQAHIANRLAEQGKKVYAMLLESNSVLNQKLICSEEPEKILPKCDVVIFPLPITTDDQFVSAPFSATKVSVERVLACIKPKTAVFAGKVGPQVQALAEGNGIVITDYLEREELAVKNAVITAEGALAIAIEEVPIAIFGSSCLITGHGRISRALMRVLKTMGAHVTVAARKYSDLAWIEAEGNRAINIANLAAGAAYADIIFNTVPSRIFTRDVLSCLKKDALLIDLASKPGGVEFDAARELGVKTIWALSLPGKTAPISAGEIILDTIGNCLAERGAL